jgi:hypothetical protein
MISVSSYQKYRITLKGKWNDSLYATKVGGEEYLVWESANKQINNKYLIICNYVTMQDFFFDGVYAWIFQVYYRRGDKYVTAIILFVICYYFVY